MKGSLGGLRGWVQPCLHGGNRVPMLWRMKQGGKPPGCWWPPEEKWTWPAWPGPAGKKGGPEQVPGKLSGNGQGERTQPKKYHCHHLPFGQRQQERGGSCSWGTSKHRKDLARQIPSISWWLQRPENPSGQHKVKPSPECGHLQGHKEGGVQGT